MRSIFFILTLAFSTSVSAQKIKESAVPEAVKKTQSQNFAGIKVEKWEKEGANFEAEFHIQKIETSAIYDASGTLIATETEINPSELPKEISDAVKTKMPGKKIKEASKIIDAGGTLSYEAEIDNVDYIFDPTGTLLREEKENDTDDDDKKK